VRGILRSKRAERTERKRASVRLPEEEERRDGVLEKGCQVWDIVHQE
jgi:hypothetical protein